MHQRFIAGVNYRLVSVILWSRGTRNVRVIIGGNETGNGFGELLGVIEAG